MGSTILSPGASQIYSFWVVCAQKNKLSIFMNVNLQVGNGVGPLSVCENCILNPSVYFAQPEIELEGLH